MLDASCMKITKIVCQILRIPNVAGQDGQQPGLGAGPRPHRHRPGRHRRGRFVARVVKAIIDAPFSHNIACGLRQIARRREPAGARAAVAEDVSPHDVLRPHGRSASPRWPPSTWPCGTSRASTSASRSTACSAASSTSGSGPTRRSCSARTASETARHRPPLARGRLPGRQVRLGADGAERSGSIIDLVRGAREGSATTARCSIDAGCVWDARTALQRAHAFAEYKHRLAGGAAARRTTIEGYVWLRDRSPRADRRRRRGMRPRIVPAADRPAAASTSTRSTSRAAASPTPPTSASASRRSAPGCATTATPARSPSPPACTG